ncbi:BQ5605_C006g04030 [Microbotryum silenes-dioicae]|uniref:ATP-dependent DNA helicase n=1 Tax=Microbotryum silenes-dioicae TaxID=796604 RepID=A0A2X0N004_9BASI|nr:BQ5605_C006g04030 [Microbotryum silenes-dioicae]
MAPHPNATSSLRHLKRSSWKLCNEYGIKNGRIDFVRLRIRVIGTLNQCLPIIPKSSPTQIVDSVDAPGGTSKTFLQETVLARIRSEGTYALAVASSRIAALLLPKGRTAHSRFKIPIDIFDDSTCNVPK